MSPSCNGTLNNVDRATCHNYENQETLPFLGKCTPKLRESSLHAQNYTIRRITNLLHKPIHQEDRFGRAKYFVVIRVHEKPVWCNLNGFYINVLISQMILDVSHTTSRMIIRGIRFTGQNHLNYLISRFLSSVKCRGDTRLLHGDACYKSMLSRCLILMQRISCHPARDRRYVYAFHLHVATHDVHSMLWFSVILHIESVGSRPLSP